MREDAFFDNSRHPKNKHNHISMPFTVSHIVAALPLDKSCGKTVSKYTALSPLIIGSMTPDVSYITPFLTHQRVDSHTLLGIYLFCIPMGLTIYFLYHCLMAPVWVSVFPKRIGQRLDADLSLGKLPNISSHVLLISLILGSVTHIIWDYFTHQSGIPQVVQWMDTPLTSIDGYNIMPYRVLQHSSSLIGLAVLLYIIYRWYQRTSINNDNKPYFQAPIWLKRLAIICLIVVPSIIAVIYATLIHPETDVFYGLYGAQIFLRHAIVMGAGLFLFSSVLLGLVYQYQIRKQ